MKSLDQQPSSGGLGGLQQGANQQPYQNIPQPTTPYASQAITPAMNQFPAPAGASFSPGLQPGGSVFGPQSQQPMPPPSGPGVSAQGRVDQEQIPSIPHSRDAAARYYQEVRIFGTLISSAITILASRNMFSNFISEIIFS